MTEHEEATDCQTDYHLSLHSTATDLDTVVETIVRLRAAEGAAEGRALKEAIATADAVLFVTPEHKRSIAGRLPNRASAASRASATRRR